MCLFSSFWKFFFFLPSERFLRFGATDQSIKTFIAGIRLHIGFSLESVIPIVSSFPYENCIVSIFVWCFFLHIQAIIEKYFSFFFCELWDRHVFGEFFIFHFLRRVKTFCVTKTLGRYSNFSRSSFEVQAIICHVRVLPAKNINWEALQA